MFKEKPVISNQHGALAMALLPYFYAIVKAETLNGDVILFGFSWGFLYLFSYPFFQLFSKTKTEKNKRWTKIYFTLSIIFISPVLYKQPCLSLFLLPLLPLVLIQLYFAKKRNERHLLNDISGILTFGIVGMATYYLIIKSINFSVLLHPSLFFLATTFYIKSLARERKNPLYMEISLFIHLLLAIVYLILDKNNIFLAYLFALSRAIVIPVLEWNIKKVGIFEFITIAIFFLSLL